MLQMWYITYVLGIPLTSRGPTHTPRTNFQDLKSGTNRHEPTRHQSVTDSRTEIESKSKSKSDVS